MNLIKIRKNNLIENIFIHRFPFHRNEEIRDLASDPKVIERANREITSIRDSILGYIDEYKQISGNKLSDMPQDVVTILAKLQILENEQIKAFNINKEDNMIRILFLSANPTNEAQLRVNQEARDIQ